MKKTTIYLPDELSKRIAAVARAEGKSKAEVIREAIAESVTRNRRPKPRIPLFRGAELSDPTVATRVDELLDGFGE